MSASVHSIRKKIKINLQLDILLDLTLLLIHVFVCADEGKLLLQTSEDLALHGVDHLLCAC